MSWVLLIPFNLINNLDTELDKRLIAAIVGRESAGEVCATRYEPHYRWLYHPEAYARRNKITVDTEVMHQKTSWGPNQVMGAVARELGFKGHLVKLCKPEIGLKYGTKHLENLLEKYQDIEEAISAYNQGSPRRTEIGTFQNQSYVDDVLGKWAHLRSLK